MGVFDRLREGLFKVRVVPQNEPENKTGFVPEKDSLPKKISEAVLSGKRIDLSQLADITSLSRNRNVKYAIFEQMAQDGRIAAAVEMYANDSVQYDQKGNLIWAESENTDIQKYVNKLINDLGVPRNLWSWAYCLCLYGDVYLETFMNTSYNGEKPTLLYEPMKVNKNIKTQHKIEGGKLERYVQKVANPADIYDLQYRGKTSGFVKSEQELNGALDSSATSYTFNAQASEIDVLSPTKYIHICLSPNIDRFPAKFTLIQEEKKDKELANGLEDGSGSEGNGGGTYTFSVLTGQSILENVYKAWQTLQLEEDSVLLERLTKSAITRIIQVELGDLPESQKAAKIRELKQQIEQQINMNKQTGDIQSTPGCQPNENIIYTATKDGKGQISCVNIGGDGDVGSLADVENSENELYAALMVPKRITFGRYGWFGSK